MANVSKVRVNGIDDGAWMNAPTRKILVGDVREQLATLPPDSVDVCMTSIPYWSLRRYNTAPQVWGGRKKCEHEWSPIRTFTKRGKQRLASALPRMEKVVASHDASRQASTDQWCRKCPAWLGELGSELNYNAYIEHIVEAFEAVRRVLKPTGNVWLNIGDCFARSVGGWKDETARDAWVQRQSDQGNTAAVRSPVPYERRGRQAGKVPLKSQMLMPARVAIALCDAGWIIRKRNIWKKDNALPESVRDRFSSTNEDVYHLVKTNEATHWVHEDGRAQLTKPEPDFVWRNIVTEKDTRAPPKDWDTQTVVVVTGDPADASTSLWSQRNAWEGRDYWFDLDSVRVPLAESTIARVTQTSFESQTGGPKDYARSGINPSQSTRKALLGLRSRVVGGADLIKGSVARLDGYVSESEGGESRFEPSFALTNGSKYASGLGQAEVQRLLRGQGHGSLKNAAALAAYRDAHRRVKTAQQHRANGARLPPEPGKDGAFHPLGRNPGDVWSIVTRSFAGAHFAVYPVELCELPIKASCPERVCSKCKFPWVRVRADKDEPWIHQLRPACACEAESEPGVVLDPFAGSGTTGIAAARLGRSSILVELNPEYAEIMRKRIEDELGSLRSVENFEEVKT